MTTTLSAHGGGAQPARIDSSGKVTGGAAMRVYGFDSEAAALAAGYVCEGGPAMSVALITDAQIASGAWKLDGDPFAVVIYTAPDSLPTEGGFAVPVYAVNGWGGAPVPSGPVLLLDLEADMLALSDGDPVGTWADQSGSGNDFTASGDTRPTYHISGGVSYVAFDGIDDWLLGSNFADGLSSFSIIFVSDPPSGVVISKIGNIGCDDPGSTGWSFSSALSLYTDSNNLITQTPTDTFLGRRIYSCVINSISEMHMYVDGASSDFYPAGGAVIGAGVTTYNNSEPVRIGIDGAAGDCDFYLSSQISAIRIYTSALSSSDRAAVEAELAIRYGITL